MINRNSLGIHPIKYSEFTLVTGTLVISLFEPVSVFLLPPVCRRTAMLPLLPFGDASCFVLFCLCC